MDKMQVKHANFIETYDIYGNATFATFYVETTSHVYLAHNLNDAMQLWRHSPDLNEVTQVGSIG